MNIITNEYPVAASSERTNRAREKMEAIITKGRTSALAVIEQVQNQIVEDRVVRGAALDFQPRRLEAVEPVAGQAQPAREFDGVEIILPDGERRAIHDHALTQLAERSELKKGFVNTFTAKGDWGTELVADNLRTIYQHGNGSRYLLRSTGEQLRGFLSDRFRRLDTRPLLDAFCESAQTIGALPIEGFALETKVRMRAVLPYVFEPINNEFIVFGLEWGNSDFGDGGHEVKLWNIRVVCANGAIADSVLRQIHLGQRLQENIEYSQRTYQLDTEANASALKDVVQHALNPSRVEQYLGAIKRASEEIIDPKAAVAALRKFMTKDETEKAVGLFNSPDVEMMPAGNTTYRLSQAVSWFANTDTLKPERKLELQQFAGDLMPKVETPKPVEV